MQLSEQQFKAIFPRANQALRAAFNRSAVRCDITSPVRLAMFCAQVGHESGGLTVFEENLNYSAARLAAVWPKRFKGADGKPNALANTLANKPRALANVVYSNRMGNGGGETDDGWRFRGRGAMQTTGRDNYTALATLTGKPYVTEPERLAEGDDAVDSAAIFWKKNGLNELADAGKFEAITRKINGGLNGLEERTKLWTAARKVLNA